MRQKAPEHSNSDYREAARRIHEDVATFKVSEHAHVQPAEGGAYVEAVVWVQDNAVLLFVPDPGDTRRG